MTAEEWISLEIHTPSSLEAVSLPCWIHLRKRQVRRSMPSQIIHFMSMSKSECALWDLLCGFSRLGKTGCSVRSTLWIYKAQMTSNGIHSVIKADKRNICPLTEFTENDRERRVFPSFGLYSVSLTDYRTTSNEFWYHKVSYSIHGIHSL